MNSESVLVPGAPVTLTDVTDALAGLLSDQQRSAYVSWRWHRWYSDTELGAQIGEARFDWEMHTHGNGFLLRKHVFSTQTAMEVLIAGLPHSPERTVQGLLQMGVRAESPTAHLEVALRMLDYPMLFGYIRTGRLPVVEAPETVAVLGYDLVVLMMQAGLTVDEVRAAVRTGDVPDLVVLRTMRALLGYRPTPG